MLQAEQFWRYSLRVYGASDVKQLCLSLQDQHGLNVNMLLLCGFLHQADISLSVKQFESLNAGMSQLNAQTKALRSERQKITDKSAVAYKSLLAQELSLEQRQQHCLIEQLNGFSFEQHMGSNFEVYAQSSGLLLSQALQTSLLSLQKLLSPLEDQNRVPTDT
ncbi:TIGR02444 family protein [Aliiglaciecola sp. LCG003]|uniref:TIGR02444 family protein n=1 Tax=Aliiglaciecola sp. LCG003 TaxID=3053655 RepID=UPI002574533B|nr:TIGR02444 family protein [Aliiglaciecola sp. LCG003]WJG09317.1 TIGR02444 family protein [Aliiglaciecola sp. LCG003]